VLGRLVKEISRIRSEVNKRDEGRLYSNEAFKLDLSSQGFVFVSGKGTVSVMPMFTISFC
jgi:hypothetical protein